MGPGISFFIDLKRFWEKELSKTFGMNDNGQSTLSLLIVLMRFVRLFQSLSVG